MKCKYEILPNGSRLAYCKNNINKITAVDIGFYCGAAEDTIPGIAHFSEHMFFAGTKNKSRRQIEEEYYHFIDTNAMTSDRVIDFTGDVFTSEFGDYLSLVAEIINQSTFKQSEIDSELKIIQQEITRSSDDFASNAWYYNHYNLTNADWCKNHILGSKQSVSTIKTKDIKSFVKKYFVAENMFIRVSSPMTYHKVKNLVWKNLSSSIKQNPKFVKLPYFSANVQNDDFLKVKYQDVDKCYIYINFVFDKTTFDHEFKAKMNLVQLMLNDTANGVMKKLRAEKHLVYSSGFSFGADDKNAYLIFTTQCDKNNVNDVVYALAEYLQELKTIGFTKDQLLQAKRIKKYNLHKQTPSVNKNMFNLNQFELYGKMLDQNKIRRIYKSTKLKECNDIYLDVLNQSRVSMSVYGNIKREDILKKQEFVNIYQNLKGQR